MLNPKANRINFITRLSGNLNALSILQKVITIILILKKIIRILENEIFMSRGVMEQPMGFRLKLMKLLIFEAFL